MLTELTDDVNGMFSWDLQHGGKFVGSWNIRQFLVLLGDPLDCGRQKECSFSVELSLILSMNN